MSTQLFAFNSGTTISGTTQVGNIAVGGYPGLGGLQWWSGPDENDKYIICVPIPAGNHKTPFGNIAYIGFNKTVDKTDQSFIDTVNVIAAKNYNNVNDCLCWLQNQGYWTSYSGTCVTTTTTTSSGLLYDGELTIGYVGTNDFYGYSGGDGQGNLNPNIDNVYIIGCEYSPGSPPTFNFYSDYPILGNNLGYYKFGNTVYSNTEMLYGYLSSEYGNTISLKIYSTIQNSITTTTTTVDGGPAPSDP